MYTEMLAEFIVQTRYKDMPLEAIEVARKHILDGLAVGLRGSIEPAGMTVARYVSALGGRAEAGVIAGGFGTSAPQAALANGVMTHVLDFDDYASAWHGHPTAVLLPTVLALGERERVSGERMLAAFIIGWEAGARIFSACDGLRLADMGWHPTAIIGTMGAAAAAARILDLNEQETRRALGIAGSQAGGLKKNSGTDTKSFHAGNAARSGVVAASLAQLGFSADEDILEGELGLPVVMTGERDSSKLTGLPGHAFSIVSSGATVKVYPSCAATHRSIDAMLELVRRHDLHAEDVVEIRCKVHPQVTRRMRFHSPKTMLEAKFSLEYCLAAALLDGELTLGQFTDEKVNSARSRELMQRVRHIPREHDPADSHDVSSLPQGVAVRLRDGAEYSHEVSFPLGSPENPVDWDWVVDKFQDCTRGILSLADGNRVKDIVSNLEEVHDITELTRIITDSPVQTGLRAADVGRAAVVRPG
ncbi:MAG: MmgE/PrpD family protein [Chloroflexi bacterium]|nr:MmgE/PrpD family protein [Chloroflexota bacterium]